jgi:Delta7-sterol 5-desaturase
LWVVEEYSLCYYDVNTQSALSIMWWFISIPLYLFVFDTIFYWSHRALHGNWAYQTIHWVHHSSRPTNTYTAFSSSALELLTEGVMSVFLPMFVVPIHYNTGRILALLILVWSCCLHAHTEFIPNWMTRFIVVSRSHHLHHRSIFCNYAMFFTFWDKLCGTWIDPPPLLFGAEKIS